MVTGLARLIDLPEPDPEALFPFGAAERTLERQRAEIRTLFAYRKATLADAEILRTWLQDHAVAETRDVDRLAAMLEERCRTIAIEPPTPDRIERIVRAAIRAHEERFAAAVHARLPHGARERLDALLHPARTMGTGKRATSPSQGCEPCSTSYGVTQVRRASTVCDVNWNGSPSSARLLCPTACLTMRCLTRSNSAANAYRSSHLPICVACQRRRA